MDLFQTPQGLIQVTYFRLAGFQTWGTPTRDALYKEQVRAVAGISILPSQYSFFVFSIKSVVSLRRRKKVGPDVENIPKLIVDAFTGVLYPDDNLDYVRGIQVEAVFGPASEECTEVWIYGCPK